MGDLAGLQGECSWQAGGQAGRSTRRAGSFSNAGRQSAKVGRIDVHTNTELVQFTPFCTCLLTDADNSFLPPSLPWLSRHAPPHRPALPPPAGSGRCPAAAASMCA